MSASKKKRERQELYESGVLDKNPAQTELSVKRKKTRKTVLILAAVVLVLGVCTTLYATGFLADHATAVTVGAHKVPSSTFNFYYHDAYFAFYEQNKEYMDMIMDTKQPLTAQIYNKEENTTWADFFIGEGKTSAEQTLALYDAAVQDGFTLSAEDEQYLTDLRTDLDTFAFYMQYKDASDYIANTYGKDCSVDEYMDYSRVRRMASGYSADYKAALSYADETIRETYTTTPADFDKVSYKVYYVTKTIGKNDDGTLLADMEAGEQMAKDMAAACKGDVDKFNEMAVTLAEDKKKDMYSDPEYTTRKNYTISAATVPLQTWLADESRQYGDTTYVQADERAYYVGFYMDRSDNNFTLPNLRIAQISSVANAKSTDDADGIKAAQALAQSVLDTYTAGARTAVGFDEAVHAVAVENTAVKEAVAYDNFTPGQLTDLSDSWCFDAARKSGDATLLKSDTGFYLVYFDGVGENYRDFLVDAKLRNADYDLWYQDKIATYTAKTNAFGLFFVNK